MRCSWTIARGITACRRLQRFKAHHFPYINQCPATQPSRDSNPDTGIPDHPHETGPTFANADIDGHSGFHPHFQSYSGGYTHSNLGSHINFGSHTDSGSNGRRDSRFRSPRYSYPARDRRRPGRTLGWSGNGRGSPRTRRPALAVLSG